MADDDKTLAEVGAEHGINVEEHDLDAPQRGKPSEIFENILWWDGGDDEDMPQLKPDDGYSVLCVWPNIVAETDDIDSINEHMSNMGCKHPVHIVGCVETLPNFEHRGLDDDDPLKTGGRIDFCFYFHDEDIYRVAVRRLQFGIRWWEDVVANDLEHGLSEGILYENYSIYPANFRAWAGDGGYNTSKTVEQWTEERSEEE